MIVAVDTVDAKGGTAVDSKAPRMYIQIIKVTITVMTIDFVKVKCRRNICTQVLTIPISYLVVAADEVKATGGNAVENKGDCE